MYGYRYLQSCQLLMLIFVVVNTHNENMCETRGKVLKCTSLPSTIPNTVQHVYVSNCDLQHDILDFSTEHREY